MRFLRVVLQLGEKFWIFSKNVIDCDVIFFTRIIGVHFVNFWL